MYKQINTFKQNNESNELLSQVIKIYNQLENIGTRFESLEKRATNNEILIRNLSDVVKDSLYQPSTGFDIDKLNNKVIQIQDYLEKSAESIEELPIEKSSKKNKTVLDGQLNILDNLINKSEETLEEITQTISQETAETFIEEVIEESVEEIIENTIEEKEESLKEIIASEPIVESKPISIPKPTAEIVDYEVVKKKQAKKGFSLFRSKSYEIEEEEPIEIVSQILSNRSESVS